MSFIKFMGMKTNESVRIIYQADQYYKAMLGLITNANESIHLQTYIFHDDSSGREIIEALKKAASRGVKVYLMVDRLGSMGLRNSIEGELKNAGIHFRFFGKFRWLKLFKKEYYIGRRLHHKVLLVDQSKAIVSGINIGKQFIPWFDFAVYVEGGCCHDLYKACIRYWPYRIRRNLKKQMKSVMPGGRIPARVLHNDGLINIQQINRSYRFYLRNAQKEIFMVSAYFFPGQRFIRELVTLKKSGVRIRILCNLSSDVPLIQKAGSHYYGELIKYGIEIFEWLPSILHGKAISIDGKIITLGSYNLNYLSHFTNIELNLEVHSEHISAEFINTLEEKMKGNVRQIKSTDVQKTLLNRISCYFAYKIVRMISIVHIFFANRSKRMYLDEI